MDPFEKLHRETPVRLECISTQVSRRLQEKEAVRQKQAADRKQKRRAREFGQLVTLMAVVATTVFVLLAVPQQAKSVLLAIWPVAVPAFVFLLVGKIITSALIGAKELDRGVAVCIGGLAGVLAMSPVCIAITAYYWRG